MQPTPYAYINELLESLLAQMQKILGKKLIGLYLYGSLVWGDFDYDTSDIDLLAALSSDLDEKEFEALQKMHADFADNHKDWDNRIEVQYFSLYGLKTFKSQATPMANISPGEPFHRIEAGKEWLMNWYFVQENGVTLYGPNPKTIIEPITKEEFLQAVEEHAKAWREYVKRTMPSRPSQAYAILTMCRALYTYKNGEQVSKRQAALWAEKELPEWSSLIQNALVWRDAWRNEHVDHYATYPETLRFVNFVIDQIVR